MSREEQWLLCPVCGAKMRLRLLQRTVLRAVSYTHLTLPTN